MPPQLRRQHGSCDIKMQEAIDYLTSPHLTYHGTLRRHVASIVRYGLLKPGDRHPETGVELPVRCGSTCGRGIYTSPNIHFSLMYSNTWEETERNPRDLPGIKLIVCATLMGRIASTDKHSSRTQTEALKGYDSQMSSDDNQYIVFDSARVLPCYVLHLDFGRESGEQLAKAIRNNFALGRRPKPIHPKLLERTIMPGEARRIKEAKKAVATKHFPFGVGSATGTNFVIEEIGEISDDEENYGEYQRNKSDVGGMGDGPWSWERDTEGATVFDEYATARLAKNEAAQNELKKVESDEA